MCQSLIRGLSAISVLGTRRTASWLGWQSGRGACARGSCVRARARAGSRMNAATCSAHWCLSAHIPAAGPKPAAC